MKRVLDVVGDDVGCGGEHEHEHDVRARCMQCGPSGVVVGPAQALTHCFLSGRDMGEEWRLKGVPPSWSGLHAKKDAAQVQGLRTVVAWFRRHGCGCDGGHGWCRTSAHLPTYVQFQPPFAHLLQVLPDWRHLLYQRAWRPPNGGQRKPPLGANV